MKIFLCPKAFRSNDDFSLQRDFLQYYISRKGIKATITDELWEAFRFRISQANENNETIIEGILADLRGSYLPENLRTDKITFQEIPAEKDYTDEELIASTNSFIERNWADIDLFITINPDKYSEKTSEKQVKVMTLEDFYLDCMNDQETRELMEAFWNHKQECTYEGE